MASQLNWYIKPFTAGADLSDKLYYLASLNSDGKVVLASASTRAIGVIAGPASQGKKAGICLSGVVKVIAGGNITAGSFIVSNANGKAIARTNEDVTLICGIALQNASADDEFLMLIK